MTTVQPSESSKVFGEPSVIIGSMASAMPGHQLRAPARAAVVVDVRVLVHLGADAVAAVPVDDAVLAGALRIDDSIAYEMSVSRPLPDFTPRAAAAMPAHSESTATSVMRHQLGPRSRRPRP